MLSRVISPTPGLARLRAAVRLMSASPGKVLAPPMVFITGEEMTHYAMNLIRDKWIEPFMDTRQWEYFDLSCKHRDATDDQVLHDAVAAGARIGAIFKEPTITPTAEQRKAMGLKKALGSPNGAMRRGWNGITISRDTIHIDGIELGFKRPVFFERHAVGGEYGAGYGMVGNGVLKTLFYPEGKVDGQIQVDSRTINDENNAVVTYHNPLDNVPDLAHHFFTRCLEADIVPYVVTKKTVFKWQEGFWLAMKKVFNEHYKEKYLRAGLLDKCGGDLQHLISDAATMQIIRWTGGGFGMAAHNYDGDMLTDEVAQVHRSPGFITSNLIGKRHDGAFIKEFEASHGTVADLYHMMLRGEETSFNPLGMVEAVIGAMCHAATLDPTNKVAIDNYGDCMRRAMHKTFLVGEGTRDMQGPSGLTTEAFVDRVAYRLGLYLEGKSCDPPDEKAAVVDPSPDLELIDKAMVKAMFDEYDIDGDGRIDLDEFTKMVRKLGVAPKTKVETKTLDSV